jgi:hypothetical protein
MDKQLYNNIIDFEEASRAWRENKISIGNGSFKYRCVAKTKNGNLCKKPPQKHKKYCHIHSALNT